MIAFSPRIHHAINFAAKHHTGQSRKGRAAPYVTHPFNVALILGRYEQPEDTIIAGLLHDVLEDCVTEQDSKEQLAAKIKEKFGPRVLAAVEDVTEQKLDSYGNKHNHMTRRLAYLQRLGSATEAGLWVCAADKIHNGASFLIDLLHAKDRQAEWNTFAGAQIGMSWWYTAVADRLTELRFTGDILHEVRLVASMIASAAITHDHEKA